MELESLLTTYGPLALGWVLYMLERRDHATLRSQVLNAFVADTEAKGLLRSTLERLVALIESR